MQTWWPISKIITVKTFSYIGVVSGVYVNIHANRFELQEVSYYRLKNGL